MAPRFKCCRKEYWKEKANLTWTSNVTKRKKLFDVDYIDDNGEIEPYPIDDVIDTVCEWKYERILDADAHRNDPKDFKDYSEFQDKYDSWKAMDKDWYQKNWTLDIQNMSWVEDTGRQVDFLIKQLQLKGTEKILDLACGFGRHSLEFARRGYDVTGIDITPAYIDYANEQAKKENLNAKFICQDIRTITFDTKTNAGTRQLPIKDDVAECIRRIIEDRPKVEFEKMLDGYTGFLCIDDNGEPLVAMHWEH